MNAFSLNPRLVDDMASSVRKELEAKNEPFDHDDARRAAERLLRDALRPGGKFTEQIALEYNFEDPIPLLDVSDEAERIARKALHPDSSY